MPYPRKGQNEADYIAEFMKSKEARESFKDIKQRAAVAYSLWRDRHKKKETKTHSANDQAATEMESGSM